MFRVDDFTMDRQPVTIYVETLLVNLSFDIYVHSRFHALPLNVFLIGLPGFESFNAISCNLSESFLVSLNALRGYLQFITCLVE